MCSLCDDAEWLAGRSQMNHNRSLISSWHWHWSLKSSWHWSSWQQTWWWQWKWRIYLGTPNNFDTTLSSKMWDLAKEQIVGQSLLFTFWSMETKYGLCISHHLTSIFPKKNDDGAKNAENQRKCKKSPKMQKYHRKCQKCQKSPESDIPWKFSDFLIFWPFLIFSAFL